MKIFCVPTLYLVYISFTPVAGQSGSPPGPANANNDAFSFRSCVQSAIMGFRNVTEDLIKFFPENKIGLSPYTSTSKIPTELTSTPEEISFNNTSKSSKVSTTSNLVGNQDVIITKANPRENIRYLLFTNKNKEQYQIMPKDGSVKGTDFNPKKKTKVLVHGLTSSYWLSSITNIWSQHIFEVKDAYLNRRQGSGYNVIVVDWTPISTVSLARYPEAARGTVTAGEDLSVFLLRLRKANNILSWDDVHLLGHSLGAHVSGIAGSKIKKASRGNMLARITGLDPAGPCFDTSTGIVENPSDILDASDAKYVDIVHTNQGNIIRSMVGRYGSAMKTGHSDFYPNGGEVQDGCNFMQDRLLFCSHQKSVVFYAKSITEKIMTCPCNDWDSFRTSNCECGLKSGGQYFGEFSDPTARGKFFLEI